MKTRIEVNLKLGLQEYTWQQPDKTISENSWTPPGAGSYEDYEPAQTGCIANAKERLH